MNAIYLDRFTSAFLVHNLPILYHATLDTVHITQIYPYVSYSTYHPQPRTRTQHTESTHVTVCREIKQSRRRHGST